MEFSQIKNIAVVGSGIMGHGIAQTFALGGYDVILSDISDEILQKAIQQIRSNLDTFLYITEYLFKDLDRSVEPPEILKKKVEQEKFGVKTGEGFFLYPPGKKEERIKERDRQFLQRFKCLYFRNSKKGD